MTEHEQLVEKLLAKPAVRAEYDKLAPEFALSEQMLGARQAAGLSRAELAEPTGTKANIVTEATIKKTTEGASTKQASVYDVANYFLYLDHLDDASDGISNLKIQKLVYYAYGFYAALFAGKPLFAEEFVAWTHGPVVPALYYHYKAYGKNALPFAASHELFRFSEAEQSLIKDVYDEFGQYSAWRLRDMTHEEKPWLDNVHREGNAISHSEMYAYFKTRVV